MKNNLDDDCYEIQETENLENYTDSILFKNFLANNQGDKKELKLSKEIIKKNIKYLVCLTKNLASIFLIKNQNLLSFLKKDLQNIYLTLIVNF